MPLPNNRAAATHVKKGLRCDEKGAHQIDAEHLQPVILGLLLQWSEHHDACVVDDYVQATKSLHGGGDRRLHLLILRDVARNTERAC